MLLALCRLLAFPGGPQLVAIHRGARGCLVVQAGDDHHPAGGEAWDVSVCGREGHALRGGYGPRSDPDPWGTLGSGSVERFVLIYRAAIRGTWLPRLLLSTLLRPMQVPAVADTRVVNVTGCGNAFCGALLQSW